MIINDLVHEVKSIESNTRYASATKFKLITSSIDQWDEVGISESKRGGHILTADKNLNVSGPW